MLCVSTQVCAQRMEPLPEPRARLILQEAEDYLTVLPEKSLRLLRDNRQALANLAEKDQLRWHLALANAARQIASPDIQLQALLAVAPLQSSDAFAAAKSEYLNNVGVWLRRDGQLAEAALVHTCGVESAADNRERLKAILNLAIVLRNQGQLSQARAMNSHALRLANYLKARDYKPVIINNLGVIALTEGKPEAAEAYFRLAMDENRSLVRRSSELLNGINLLLSFTLQDTPLMFDRLLPRVERMLEAATTPAREAYLTLVKALHQHNTGESLPAAQTPELVALFEQTNDSGIQGLLRPHFLKAGISMPPPARVQASDTHLFQSVTGCDWPKYRDTERVAKLVDELIGENG